VTGVDLSERMVALANANAGTRQWAGPAPTFETADLREFRSGRTFDVVVSLFHVMSYQVRNEDLRAAMATAAAHLAPGGLFIFDCWHGPGVLTDPPAVRVRRLEGEGYAVTRIAEPEHRSVENRVDVHYEILVERGGAIERFRECHAMRYLFTPEVDLLLAGAGLERIAASRWLDRAPPDTADWNACYVARK
jgi:SAM-dependent methyltransferase